MTVTDPMRSRRAWCVWPTKKTSGVVVGGSARSSSNASWATAGLWTMIASTWSRTRWNHAWNADLLLDRRRPAVVAVALVRPALERVVVARDAQARLLDDDRPVAAVGHEAAAAREDDRAGASEPAVERVGVVVAGDVDERPAGVGDPADEIGLQRRARVAEVADEEQRPAIGRPLERGDGQDVRVQVRRDGEPREAVERLPARGIGDEPREADELGVELVVEARRGEPQGLQRLERARDVRAVGVVLRLGVRAERGRQQERDEQRREQRGARRRPGA